MARHSTSNRSGAGYSAPDASTYPDDTFKSGFEGCVLHMQVKGYGVESATKLCSSLKAKMGNRITKAAAEELILNRGGAVSLIGNRSSFDLPADGWIHVVPKGEFYHSDSGLMQVIDDEACASIVNRFAQDSAQANFPGVLIDFDHFSQDPEKSSEAAAWALELQNRTDGVWAKPKWSDIGTQAVTGGRYRLVSPVWKRGDCQNLENNRVRPLRIDTIALTNDPNLKGLTPISNRASSAATTNHIKNMDHKSALATILGVAATATDVEMQTAYDAEVAAGSLANRLAESQAEVGTLKNRVTELEKESDTLTAELVESDLKTYAGVIHDPASIKTQLIANRSATVAILKGIKPPVAAPAAAASRPPLYNRNATVKPPETAAADSKNASSALLNRAMNICKIKKIPWRDAFELAQGEVVGA